MLTPLMSNRSQGTDPEEKSENGCCERAMPVDRSVQSCVLDLRYHFIVRTNQTAQARTVPARVLVKIYLGPPPHTTM